MPLKKTKTAIIGAGRIGKMHAENLIRFIPNAELKTIFDKYKKTSWLKRLIPFVAQPIRVTADLNEILNDSEIEAVVIASSTTSHVPLINQILPYGKHIFCEKPIALESSKFKQIKEKIKKNKVVFQVGYNRRFDRQFLELKKKIQKKKIGRPYMIKIINRDPLRPPLNFIPKSGGLFFDFNVHDFDMIHFLSGQKVKEVMAMGENLIDPAMGKLEDIDTALITLKLSNQVLVNVDSSRETHYGYDQQIEVFGSRGSLQVENILENSLVLSSKNGVVRAKPSFNFITRYQVAFLDQMKSFFSSIQQNKPATVTIDDAHRAICVAEATLQSLKQKKTIAVKY